MILEQEKKILVGVILSAHGIKGDVVLKSFTEDPKNILSLPTFTSNETIIKIAFVRNSKDGKIICSVEGVVTRSVAESMKGTEIYCYRENLPDLEEDEFYFEDLKTLRVVNVAGEEIGNVSAVMNYGASDIIEITFNHPDPNNPEAKGKYTLLFPFTKETFPTVTKREIVFNGTL